MKGSITIWVVAVTALLACMGCETNPRHENHQAMQHEHNSDKYLEEVVLPANEFVLSDQATIKPVYTNSDELISAFGYVAVDQRRNMEVPSRVSGRIEKLYVRYNYQHVRKGEKIADLYSPELNAYLQEYLFVRRMSEDSSIINAAKEKLILLGVRRDELSQIELQGRIGLTTEIICPTDGFVLFSKGSRTEPVETSKSEMGSMDEVSSAPNATLTNEGRIREGDYVNQGQTLFYVNDLKEVWGVLSFPANHQSLISKNLPVEIKNESNPNTLVNAKIDFIEPIYDNGQKFLQARVYLRNDNLRLKPESFLRAEVRSSTTRKLILPSSSVQHFGKHDIVWKKIRATENGSVFQATIVTVGMESGDSIEIVAGLAPTDEVARDAAYLMDSQSLLNPK